MAGPSDSARPATQPPNRRYTDEAANVAAGADVTAAQMDPRLLAFKETGGFFDLLAAQNFSLLVSREYEHLLLALDGGPEGPHQSPFPLPHPSGFCFDPASRELVVSSTRTPNILIWFTPFEDLPASREIRPPDMAPPAGETLFLPRKARYLPGSLSIHDLVRMNGQYFATITGHNFLGRLSIEAGFERIWWPAALDALGTEAFDKNYFQLNSVAAGGSPEASFYTAFADITAGVKPWQAGYGPREKGVVFSGRTRVPILRGLTCPHSAKLNGGKLWLCNSGFGTIGYVDGYETHDPSRTRYVPVARAPGFTRGLAFAGDLMFVGLSKVIPQYEPYAPGLEASTTCCGIWVFDRRTGREVASLRWPEGYQIYDLQLLPGVKRPRFPLAARPSDGVNALLRFLA
jgi:uncharacterized protein (TIGR03032 family)